MLRVVQRFRIEWGHCDPAGIIFNPNYARWMDGACHSLFKAAGVPMAEMMRTSGFIGCPLVKSELEFARPAYYDDVISVTSQIGRFGGKSFDLSHVFRRGDEMLAEGREVRVWGYADETDSRQLSAQSIPEEIKARLSEDREIDVSP